MVDPIPPRYEVTCMPRWISSSIQRHSTSWLLLCTHCTHYTDFCEFYSHFFSLRMFKNQTTTHCSQMDADTNFSAILSYSLLLKPTIDYSQSLYITTNLRITNSVQIVICEWFANSEFGKSDSCQFTVLLVRMRIIKGHKFDLSKFESPLYTYSQSHMCNSHIFI